MSTAQNPEDFYTKLLLQLEETTTFPTVYLYKFIIPTNKEEQKKLLSKFDNLGATIDTKHSKNGKYTSFSIHVNMKTAAEVVKKYKDVSDVKGIISL